MPSSSQIQSAFYKMWNGKPRLACVNIRQPPSKTPLDAGVKANDRADRLTGKATVKSGLPQSEDLKRWGAWDNTWRHKATDITPSIAWRGVGFFKSLDTRFCFGNGCSVQNFKTIYMSSYELFKGGPGKEPGVGVGWGAAMCCGRRGWGGWGERQRTLCVVCLFS